MKESADTVMTVDSIAGEGVEIPDSLAHAGEQVCVMAFDPIPVPAPEPHDAPASGLSWLLTALLALFVLISLRFRKNTRFLAAMINELTEVRERPNALDDTVRETSFILMLNLMWCLSAGVLLMVLLEFFGLAPPTALGSPYSFPVLGTLICIGVAVAYTLFMLGAYYVVGIIFTDYGHTEVWVKGFLSAHGLDALVLFPLALLSITLPAQNGVWLLVAGIAFALTKIVFIYKGFRIFFNQTASWVIFLYYLCSLEIVPLILTGVAAFQLCSLLT